MDSGRIMKELRELQEGVKNVSIIPWVITIANQQLFNKLARPL